MRKSFIILLLLSSILHQIPKGFSNEVLNSIQQIKELAENGNPKAQYYLGLAYHQGKKIKKNDSLAIQWIIKSSLQDYAEAQYFLAYCYSNGIGVKKDPVLYTHWIKKAAENGHQDAQKIVQQSLNQLPKKAKQGDLDAQYLLGKQHLQSKQYKQAITWLLRSANKGHKKAQWQLGKCYFFGHGLKQNQETALSWFNKSAQQKFRPAQRDLGLSYMHGYGTTKNLQQAILWFTQAAKQGDVESQTNLGLIYADQNKLREAAYWYKLSIQGGSQLSILPLGLIYSKAQQFDKAMVYFRKAAANHNQIAMYQIGNFYELGLGIDRNLVEAVSWYKKSADLGYIPAREKIGIAPYRNAHLKQVNDFIKKQNYDAAIQEYFKLIKLDSGRSETYALSIIDLKIKQGKLKEAESELSSFMKKSKFSTALTFIKRSELSLINQKPKEALKYLNMAIKKFPHSIEAYQARARFYANHGKQDFAKKDHSKALELEKIKQQKLKSKPTID